MIDINLAQTVPKVRGISSKSDGSKMLGIIAVSVIFVALVTVISAKAVLKFQNNLTQKASIVGVVTNARGVTNSSRVTSVSPTKAVSSADNDNAKVVLISYNDMSELEKINYEMKLPHILFREIAEGIPAGVDFRKLSLTNFENLSGSGVVEKKLDAGLMLSFFMGENWKLAPKPTTIIRKNGDYFRFDFSADYTLSSKKLTTVVISKSDIPDISTLNSLKDFVAKTADQYGINLSGNLGLSGSELGGEFNHYEYQMSGECSFSSFRLFLAQIYKSGKPIRFKTVELNAAGNRINFTATVVISAV